MRSLGSPDNMVGRIWDNTTSLSQQTLRGVGDRMFRLYVDGTGDFYGQYERNDPQLISSLGGTASAVGVPVGAIFIWGSSTPPLGYLLCDGSSAGGYPKLAAVLGTSFGGIGSTPDLSGRVVVGPGTPSYSEDWDGPLGLGSTGGSPSVKLNSKQLPRHSHDISPANMEHTHTITTSNHTHALADAYDEGGSGIAQTADHAHTLDFHAPVSGQTGPAEVDTTNYMANTVLDSWAEYSMIDDYSFSHVSYYGGSGSFSAQFGPQYAMSDSVNSDDGAHGAVEWTDYNLEHDHDGDGHAEDSGGRDDGQEGLWADLHDSDADDEDVITGSTAAFIQLAGTTETGGGATYTTSLDGGGSVAHTEPTGEQIPDPVSSIPPYVCLNFIIKHD